MLFNHRNIDVFFYIILDKEPEPPRREAPPAPPPAEAPKHQQRPSLISLFTGNISCNDTNWHLAYSEQNLNINRINLGGQHPSSHLSSIYHLDSRPVTAICTQLSSQQTLHPPRGESLSSSSTTTNKEIASDGHSTDGLTLNASNNANGSSTLVMGGSSANSISESGPVPYLTHSMSLQQHQSWKMQQPRLRFVSSVEFRHSSGETSTTPLSPESPVDYSSGETNKPSRLQRSKAQSRKTFRSRRNRSNTGEVNIISCR